MNKKSSTSKKDDQEEPLIDQSSEGLKKLILKGNETYRTQETNL